MRKLIKIIASIILFTILTLVSQIGGLVYFIGIWITKRTAFRIPGKGIMVFILLYSLATFLIVPLVSPIFGRVKIENNSKLKPVSYITILLNRNYMDIEANVTLKKISNNLNNSNIQLRYLDANFPFIDGFPLLPHLSHNDGRKIDFSLVYEDQEGNIINKSKSNSGYGVFENPKKGEFNQCKACLSKGYFQYDYPKYLTFGKINDDLIFSKQGSKELIEIILHQKAIAKIFIEPHLKQRLGIKDSRVRFHGCGAVRHDDHIHVQIN